MERLIVAVVGRDWKVTYTYERGNQGLFRSHSLVNRSEWRECYLKPGAATEDEKWIVVYIRIHLDFRGQPRQ